MPLMKRPSHKAFEHNVEAEMHAGKPKDQSLAIAYSVQRKAKKKMAEGGAISASTERRPMHDQSHNDSVEKRENDHMKAQTLSAAMETRPMPKKGLHTTPIKHPRMAHSDVLQAKLRDEEDHLQMLAEGGELEEDDSEVHGMPADEDDSMEPSPMMPANKAHAKDSRYYADGGEVSPEDEEELEHHASIASAIMAKRRMMAEGGEVDIDENAEEVSANPSPYDHQNMAAAMRENYDSDMDDVSEPMESNEMDDPREEDEEDDHDKSIAAKIRRQMKMRSPITR